MFCCCCRVADDFNRADASIPGDDWTVVSGTAFIASNKLSGNLFTAYWNKARSGLQSAAVKIGVIPSGGKVRLLLAYDPVTGYYAAADVSPDSTTGLNSLSIVTNNASGEYVDTGPKYAPYSSYLAATYRPSVGGSPATITAAIFNNLGSTPIAAACSWYRELQSDPAGTYGGILVDSSSSMTFDDWSYPTIFIDRLAFGDVEGICGDIEPGQCGIHQPFFVNLTTRGYSQGTPASLGNTINESDIAGIGSETFTTGGVTLYSQPHNRGSTFLKWKGAIGTGAGTSRKIYFNWFSSTNHYYLKFSLGSFPSYNSSIELHKVQGGDTLIATSSGSGSDFSTENWWATICTGATGSCTITLERSSGVKLTITQTGLTWIPLGYYWNIAFGYFNDVANIAGTVRGVTESGSIYDNAYCESC